MQRVNLGKAAPELYKTVAELDQLAMQKIKQAKIADGFAHLLKLRASQINQCAFCIRMHSHDALKSGETIDRIVLLDAWRECEYFTEKEQAALILVEEVTLLAVQHFPEQSYQKAREQLSNEEIAAIEWIAIVINAWNRIAIASHYRVAAEQ
ncbi:carboxymuconolactone decarboxylase family protein [Acinetobacter gerneri]|uniref:Carboxymuconolactone decarboxylase family protein n=1 Tax=Acinetobacter gerneri TaxID=202952 RepID=A0AAW8JE07_9GAMM|nr:carboxymuconolactone decarboxylase family protein [Acinetobacter gerneri]MDQ9008863.1 carboxymuconolactone decarboxylase family protein [Acinetobacter gerneri]MDQ9012967.1 carboxymuconolactone decarboxylase family protein [Acinetobacter gerneri]MDQ9024395.1 carboxymuconolactone decarboxylase family protein [Acinetobacter gerneri]MDQ9051639.1 carboxymuconolactone decarboxylase family protein [Acinetobacter gerneri]MDQ9059037.1 carboxymuconolactone decarboxylase family protein [Acinetobacter 